MQHPNQNTVFVFLLIFLNVISYSGSFMGYFAEVYLGQAYQTFNMEVFARIINDF